MENSTRTHKVFSFKDNKSASYGPPFTHENSAMVIRQIQEAFEAPQKPIWARHPQDFSLFDIGEWSPESGTITMHETKNCIGLVQDFKNSLD